MRGSFVFRVAAHYHSVTNLAKIPTLLALKLNIAIVASVIALLHVIFFLAMDLRRIHIPQTFRFLILYLVLQWCCTI